MLALVKEVWTYFRFKGGYIYKGKASQEITEGIIISEFWNIKRLNQLTTLNISSPQFSDFTTIGVEELKYFLLRKKLPYIWSILFEG